MSFIRWSPFAVGAIKASTTTGTVPLAKLALTTWPYWGSDVVEGTPHRDPLPVESELPACVVHPLGNWDPVSNSFLRSAAVTLGTEVADFEASVEPDVAEVSGWLADVVGDAGPVAAVGEGDFELEQAAAR